MKSVLEKVDAEAFVFLKCKVQLPDGTDGPVRWLCDIVRVLDALDEEKSKITIRTADNGNKVYNFSGGVNLVFKEDAIRSHHIFRMKYYDAAVICDEQMRLACKAAGLKGIGFGAQRLRVKDSAFTFCQRGETHHAEGNLDLAVNAYTEAIRLGSRDRLLARYFYQRGQAYFQMNDHDRAIADYSEVIRLSPIGPEAGAIADHELAIRLTRLADAYHGRGKAYLKKDDRDRAAQDFETAKHLGYDKYLIYQKLSGGAATNAPAGKSG
jgi:tetratricopeptide (TPR) repeat protein